MSRHTDDCPQAWKQSREYKCTCEASDPPPMNDLADQEDESGPFPVSERLRLLSEATAHLLSDHDCDHHGYETWRAALLAEQGAIKFLENDPEQDRLLGEVDDAVEKLNRIADQGVSPSKRFLATATAMNHGVAKCDECGEIMLEDERHWHIAS